MASCCIAKCSYILGFCYSVCFYPRGKNNDLVQNHTFCKRIFIGFYLDKI